MAAYLKLFLTYSKIHSMIYYSHAEASNSRYPWSHRTFSGLLDGFDAVLNDVCYDVLTNRRTTAELAFVFYTNNDWWKIELLNWEVLKEEKGLKKIVCDLSNAMAEKTCAHRCCKITRLREVGILFKILDCLRLDFHISNLQ